MILNHNPVIELGISLTPASKPNALPSGSQAFNASRTHTFPGRWSRPAAGLARALCIEETQGASPSQAGPAAILELPSHSRSLLLTNMHTV